MQLCDHVTVSFVLYNHILKSSFKLVFSQLIVSAVSVSCVYFLNFLHLKLFIKSTVLCVASAVLIMNTVTSEQRHEYLMSIRVQSAALHSLMHHVVVDSGLNETVHIGMRTT